MTFWRQFLSLLGSSLAALVRRPGTALTITIGVTGAVGVLVSMLAMGSGARRQALGDAREDRVEFFSVGSRGLQSSIPRSEAQAILDLPGIKKDPAGKPIVVFRTLVPIEARRLGTGTRIFFPLIGVTGAPLGEFAPELRITAGRMFRSGLRELIASAPCARQLHGFALGEQRSVQGLDWTIVGRFDFGSNQQCLVFVDADVLMSSFKTSSFNQVGAMLDSAQEFTQLQKALANTPTIHAEVVHERAAAEEDVKELNALLNFAAYFVGSIMAVGATLGAVNSLYTIIDSRRREIATLRAIGFGAGPVGSSILCESVLLALPGALLGVLLAWALFQGMAVSPFGFNFELEVTPALALVGVVWALMMGIIGGLLPALRGARLPVSAALRAS